MQTKHTPGPHQHQYLPHPKWETHYYCRICGFAIAKPLSRDALKCVVNCAAIAKATGGA